MIHATAKLSERTNWNLLASNKLVQLLALYTDPVSHGAQNYRQGCSNNIMKPVADHAVNSRIG